MKSLFIVIIAILLFTGCTKEEDEGRRATCAYKKSSGSLGCNDSYTLNECKSAANGREYNFGGDSCADVRYRCSYGTCPW
jgi:hypothetical protein